MEKIAVIGEIDSIGMQTLQEYLGYNFEIKSIEIEDRIELAKVNYIILRSDMNKDDISYAVKTKLIQRWGVGYDFVDIKTAGENGIQVGITTGANSGPVAEYTVLMMLAVYRQLVQSHNATVNGRWKQDIFQEQSYMIKGKKVGLIGFGNIGRKVARILHGFSSNIYYYDVFKLHEAEEKVLNIEYLSFEDIIKNSDIISLHIPLTKGTRNIIAKKELDSMKNTAILINTSRGGLINESDLYHALNNNDIMGAGLDVFESEPPNVKNSLFGLKNIIVSSHIAGNTFDNSEIMAKKCVECILRVSNGQLLIPPDLVNDKYLNQDNIRILIKEDKVNEN